MRIAGAHICIQPDFSLKETARIISEALNVSLKVDESGYYEEFPVYSGVARNLSFALLGPPEAKYMVGEPCQHYELRIRPISDASETNFENHLQNLIVAQGRLRSELRA